MVLICLCVKSPDKIIVKMFIKDIEGFQVQETSQIIFSITAMTCFVPYRATGCFVSKL